ncbi:MAG: recombination mediator RecR [Desulfocucumaceae bacterium]
MSGAGPISRLVDEFARLPGIGPKTAQRLAFHVLNAPPEMARGLARALVEARENISRCSGCCDLTDSDPCGVCRDTRRSREIICVVEQPRDVIAIEKSRSFRGLYHVLHGAISPMGGIGPGDLTVRDLLERLARKNIGEVILATNPNVEGDATALYLARLIKPSGIRVTRLAHGLPVGASLEYADEMTLSKALEGRQELG